MVVSVILFIFYTMGVYFTYVDGSVSFDKNWNNEERMKKGGLGRRDLDSIKKSK